MSAWEDREYEGVFKFKRDMRRPLIISKHKINRRLHTTIRNGFATTVVRVGKKFNANPYGFKFKLRQYRVEPAEDLVAMHGLDIEEELAKTLVEEMTKEIELNGTLTWDEFCEKNKIPF